MVGLRSRWNRYGGTTDGGYGICRTTYQLKTNKKMEKKNPFMPYHLNLLHP
jgi:hypothetical protein